MPRSRGPDDATVVEAEPSVGGDPFGLGPGDEVERYRIIDRIGVGGMGVVYRAHDPGLDRQIALKLVRADRSGDGSRSQARLLREAQAMAQVSHPNVLPIYDVGALRFGVFIAMEYVQGESLLQWIRKGPAPAQIVDVFIQAGRGLVAVHAAGLIHRDFKPSNVLIDDRVLIMDFGLARSTGAPTEDAMLAATPDSEPPVIASGGQLSTQLTVAGTVLGTPAYMAPEQMVAGRPIDERVDQFAFCVALFEMLLGTRPYADGAMLDLYRDKSQQRWLDVEPEDPLTRRLLPVLRRGLAADPPERWPSMRALVEALEAASAPAARRHGWWLTGAVAVATVGLWLALTGGETAADCEDNDPLANAWSDTQRDAIQGAWQQSEARFWEQAWAGVHPRLDAHAEQLRDQYREVCEAIARGEADPSGLLDRRTACLDDRRRRLAALADTLARDDASVVETAATGAAALPRAEACADPRYLASAVPVPAAEQLEAVHQIRERLARAEVLTEVGRPEEALVVVEEALALAAQLDYPPVAVEAAVQHGRVELRRGHLDEAREILSQAYFDARELSHDEAAFSAVTTLIRVSTLSTRLEDGLHWARTAEALLPAMGEQPAARATVAHRVGALMAELGRDTEALATLTEAVALEREIHGARDLRVAQAQLTLGHTLRRQGRLDEAEASLRAALATAELAYDPTHPSVAKYHNGLGNVLTVQQKYDEALDCYERADTLIRTAYGDDDARRAGFLLNRGQLYTRRGQFEQARDLIAEALLLWEEALGVDHPRVGMAVNNLGVVYEGLRDDQAAVVHYRRALRIAEQTLGDAHPSIAVAHRNLGEPLFRLGERSQARRHYEQVLAIAEHSEVAADDIALARFGLARLRWPGADEAQEPEGGVDPKAERGAARALAEQAHASMVQMGEPMAAEAELVARWLAQHPRP